MGKGLPLLGRWGKITHLRVSHTFPVVTVLRLSSHLPPFRVMAPLFFTQLSGAVKVNHRTWADKNVTSRICFPNVTHTSWGDAGSKLSLFVPFPGERISLSPCCICKAFTSIANDEYTNWFNKLYLSSLYNSASLDVPQLRNTA